MKTVLLSTAAVALLVSSLLAQDTPEGGLRRRATNISEVADDAARFDLKFPGGKVKEFVAAVSKALGKPVNVIIPKESEETLIPAMDVSRVTVRGLFRALSNASKREVAVPVNIQTTGTPRGVLTNTSVQYKIVSFTFSTEEANPSPDAVWTFIAINPTPIPAEEPVVLPRTVQYYPVAEYLSHFSVEDITTAIESGWKLQGEAANPPPTIRFHEETKLLIIAGTPAQMEMIPQVLKGLSQMLRYPRSESLPITRKAGRVILPKIEFREATLREAVDFIRKKTAELDPERLGFNIVLQLGEPEPDRRVTLSLTEVPASEVLKLIAEAGGLELEIRDHAMVLRARPLQTPPAFAPVPASSFPLPGFPVPPTPPSLPAK